MQTASQRDKDEAERGFVTPPRYSRPTTPFNTTLAFANIMSEPLTPPPTSAIEIQDAARSSLPPAETDGAEPIVTDPPTQDATSVAAAPAQAQFSTPYHFLFPSLTEYAGNSNYKELVRQAERGDLNVCPVHSSIKVVC